MKPNDSFRDIITSCEERFLSMNCQAFLIRRLYQQLEDKNQGTRYFHEKGMRRNVVWNTFIYRNWVSSLEFFTGEFWELSLRKRRLCSFICNINPESFIVSPFMGGWIYTACFISGNFYKALPASLWNFRIILYKAAKKL